MQQMSLNDYQKEAARTLIDRPDSAYTDAEMMLVWNTLGLVGEAAEVAALADPQRVWARLRWRSDMRKELGDLCWYVAAIATHQGWQLQDLADRFSADAPHSIQRLALAISALAGEVADWVKKGVFHRQPLHIHRIEIALGKILSLIASMAASVGSTPDQIHIANIDKLKIRYPNGWSSADAEARVDAKTEPAGDG